MFLFELYDVDCFQCFAVFVLSVVLCFFLYDIVLFVELLCDCLCFCCFYTGVLCFFRTLLGPYTLGPYSHSYQAKSGSPEINAAQ